MNMNFIILSHNVPQEFRLKSTQEYPLADQGCFYETADGRWLLLDKSAAQSIKTLQIQAGESFHVCRRVNRNDPKPYWDIWLSPETEKLRAVFDLAPTGTEGPRTQRAAPPRPALVRAARVPYNVAFREILRFVIAGLKNAGEQWNDQAKQDAVCTALIQADRDGHLTLWERNQ